MIGIFDSGIGGMTVARAIEQILPEFRFIYFGDLARTPYGSKSAATIIDYAVEDTEFLLAHGAKVIIIACNTAASVASTVLRQKFSVPIFEVITPAVLSAINQTTQGRIGVIGTRATIRSGIYEQLISRHAPDFKVFSQACPLLVPIVEEGWLDKQESKMIIKRYLHPLKSKQIDTLVLGCTHYPLLKKLIQPKIGRKTTLIDSSHAVARELKRFLETSPEIASTLERNGESRFYVSDSTEAAMQTARSIFGRNVTLIKESLA